MFGYQGKRWIFGDPVQTFCGALKRGIKEIYMKFLFLIFKRLPNVEIKKKSKSFLFN